MYRNLKAYRVKFGLTQVDLAKKLDITPGAYSFKETGRTQFTLKEAKLIADLFGTTIDELFFES